MTDDAVEIADIVRQHGEDYLTRYGGTTSWHQRRVLLDISRCRTSAMGGHVEVCAECGWLRNAYNSCRNRHCPKCLGSARQRWVRAREAELLNVPYFHVVFTLPRELAHIGLTHPRVVYDCLFRAAAKTLTTVAADPKHLGAKIGFLAVLHTWGQKLEHHPHLHCVVPGGGLSLDGSCWIPTSDTFFLPVRVLSRVFRGTCLELLERAVRDGRLTHRGGRRHLNKLLAQAACHEWVVYSKRPFGGPRQVVRYLARYTHRVAISNHRLVALEDGQVRFRYRGYADNRQTKTLSLTAIAFLRRFLIHVLPPGFTRIRYYGLLANRNRQRHIALCRERIAEAGITYAATPEPELEPVAEPFNPERCQVCPNGIMRLVRSYARPFLAPQLLAAPTVAWDTS